MSETKDDRPPVERGVQCAERDRTWIMRTYSGHSSAAESNALFHKNLSKGQTGLSIAFDLPTQTGYDPDHDLAKPEVGKVGVPVSHLGDMRALLAGLPLDTMNTSMTINATAVWLFALYVALAQETGVDPTTLRGTTQNDVMKEFLARGTYIFPPGASLKLSAELIVYAIVHVPKWNPINICSYHLQEAGATPEQEVAYALLNAISTLDAVRAHDSVDEALFEQAFARVSFFVNAGIRFIEEHCKLRAFTELWREIGQERYGITNEKALRFRYGVQVNSLGLTEQQPENNIMRIAFEMLGVTLGKDARARAVQLPAWNEALGLPRAWDQQLSLRTQQILAEETDLLEYGDIFRGSEVIERKTIEMKATIKRELEQRLAEGGIVSAVASGELKSALVRSAERRLSRIESGEQVLVGVNAYQHGEVSPLGAGRDAVLRAADDAAERASEALIAWRGARDNAAAEQACEGIRQAIKNGGGIVEASIVAAKAGVTTGEWADTIRSVVGEYRAPTGVDESSTQRIESERVLALRKRLDEHATKSGRRAKLIVGKPGLDGHSNGAEQIALKAKSVGFEVVYVGIRQTPAALAQAAIEEDAHLIGLSVLSGSHLEMARAVVDVLGQAGANIPVVLGGIVPTEDRTALLDAGIHHVFTPSDYDLDAIMEVLADTVGA